MVPIAQMKKTDLEILSGLPKVIQLKRDMILLIPDRAFLSKFNQVSVLGKFVYFFLKIKQYYDYDR